MNKILFVLTFCFCFLTTGALTPNCPMDQDKINWFKYEYKFNLDSFPKGVVELRENKNITTLQINNKSDKAFFILDEALNRLDISSQECNLISTKDQKIVEVSGLPKCSFPKVKFINSEVYKFDPGIFLDSYSEKNLKYYSHWVILPSWKKNGDTVNCDVYDKISDASFVRGGCTEITNLDNELSLDELSKYWKSSDSKILFPKALLKKGPHRPNNPKIESRIQVNIPYYYKNKFNKITGEVLVYANPNYDEKEFEKNEKCVGKNSLTVSKKSKANPNGYHEKFIQWVLDLKKFLD